MAVLVGLKLATTVLKLLARITFAVVKLLALTALAAVLFVFSMPRILGV